MIIYNLWKEDSFYDDMLSILIKVLLTPIGIIFDLILSPFEIIAFILYKVIWHKIEKKWENDRTRKL